MPAPSKKKNNGSVERVKKPEKVTVRTCASTASTVSSAGKSTMGKTRVQGSVDGGKSTMSKAMSQSSAERTKGTGPTAPPGGCNEELLRLIGKSLTQNPWYHGLMPRQDCEDLLKIDGDFLVRKTTVGKTPTYCISVHLGKECKHIPVHFINNKWSLKEVSRITLAELIDYCVESGKPVPPSNAILKKAVPRPEYYILHENITLKNKLGAGAFGEVFTGLFRRKVVGKVEEEEIKVAVKKIKGQVNKQQLGEFVKEAKLMRRFDHANIVRLYGIAPQEEPIMIVLEMAEGGSLKSYCEKNPGVPLDKLNAWGTDGARGMAYLSSRQVIHRDLAARNCLLGGNAELKISDFGLSIADKNQIQLDKMKSMPIKWLSPETLKKGMFSFKTDVWSFGVLLWEIFARCKSDPFPGENNQQARVKILSGKDPMDPPPETPETAVKVMKMCFIQDPDKRPDFVTLFKLFAPNEEPPKAGPAGEYQPLVSDAA